MAGLVRHLRLSEAAAKVFDHKFDAYFGKADEFQTQIRSKADTWRHAVDFTDYSPPTEEFITALSSQRANLQRPVAESFARPGGTATSRPRIYSRDRWSSWLARNALCRGFDPCRPHMCDGWKGGGGGLAEGMQAKE